jgi:trk system potassium uptake protein TrkH
MLLILLGLTTSIVLYLSGEYSNPLDALRFGFFQSVSISTTTGFTTAGFDVWPSVLPLLLLFASFVGGCAGSTGGGLKVIRVILLVKQGAREITRLVHPNAEVPIKVGGTTMSSRVIDAVWGFFAIYVATFGFVLLALMATGLDQVSAFSATVASMNNMGPGLGEVAKNYANISDAAKWVLCLAMLLGRLEIFTLLVILTPRFWRD